MNRVNSNLFVFVVAMVFCASVTAQGGIIDTFSSDSSAKYNYYLNYDLGFVGGAQYGIVNNQFVPTVGTQPATSFGGGTEDLWFRNDYTFGVGDTISVDLVGFSGSDTNVFGGLLFSNSPGSNRRFAAVTRNANNSYAVEGWGAGDAIPVADFSFTNPAKISATRISDTNVSFAVNYTNTSNLPKSVTGTCIGALSGTSYFGMERYSTGFAVPTLDNLATSAAIPEPSSFVLLIGGLIGLLCYAWRKRKQ